MTRLMHCEGTSSLKSDQSIDWKLYVDLWVRLRVLLYTIATPPPYWLCLGMDIDL